MALFFPMAGVGRNDLQALGCDGEHPGGKCFVGSTRIAGTEFQTGETFRQPRGHLAGRCHGLGRDRAATLDQDDRIGQARDQFGEFMEFHGTGEKVQAGCAFEKFPWVEMSADIGKYFRIS